MLYPHPPLLTGPTLCALMRTAHVTIRDLATKLQIPMTRVRRRRLHGIEDPYTARDWLQAILGRDPGPIPGLWSWFLP
jgi:hypothetical protein